MSSKESHSSLSFSNEEKSRYSRQLILPEVGPEGQKKLKGSSVLIVGAGGLGVPAAVSLVTAGVGTIGLVDGDSVELPNLHRQFLYSAEDIGRDKVEVAAERLLRLNPNVKVNPYSKHLDSSNALGILDDYDVVVDATDNFPSRYLINDACVILGKPDVYASVLRLEGQASVFFPPGGPCYRCLFPEPPPPDSVPSCSEAGVLGAVTGVLGGIQAIQAVNLILGGGQTLVGRLLIFDAHETSFEELKIRRSKECTVCGVSPAKVKLIDYERFCGIGPRPRSGVKEVEPTDLSMSLDSGEKPLLLDVREPHEYRFCHIEGSKLIPLGELTGRLKELDGERDIVVYCHTGVRSAKAAGILADYGFRRVRNLRGGIKAWSEEVDARIPSY